MSGDRVGIYGGTTQLSVCDTQQLVSFLEQNPQRGAAWARVLGIGGAEIRSYVGSLTPVVLAADTRVTNHGYRDGRATARQSVLQAGTAVLVDNRGVPRVRCYCGNPLVEPVVRGAPTYTGTKWPSFTPERIIVVQPASQPIQQITTINVNGGGPLVLPAGGTTTAPAPASTAPPIGTGTTTTASPRPTSPPTGSAPAAGTPTTVPRFAPPPPGTQPSESTYQLASIRVTRAYGGFIDDDLAYANAVQPGSSTVGPGERRFQVGWDFRWPRGTMVNRNRAMGTVTFTQLAATIAAGTPAPLQVTMTGEWDTSGYGVDRRHTIALSGPGVAPVSREVPGPPSGSLQGSITTTQGSSPPVISGSRAVVQVTANINFGDDHTGQLVIELLYERT